MLRPVTLVALGWAAFQIYIWWNPELDLLFVRSAHLGFALATACGLYAAQGSGRLRHLWYIPAVLAAVPPAFHFLGYDRWISRISGLDPVYWSDVAVACLLGLLLLVVSLRSVGKGMTIVVLAFVAYQLFGAHLPAPLGHNQDGYAAFVDQQVLTMDGIYGIPLGISLTVVFYFILFASVFELFGGGKMIVDLALAATGRFRGGPAKAAVVGSAMTGLVSGSAVANVMSSGIFTIPLMKRVGYRPHFAAAVEAVVSTGGQLMPPVMGAAAFIMADMLRLPYVQLLSAAALPAALYFVTLFITVDFESRLHALDSVPKEELTPTRLVLRDSGHMLIPIAWLAWRIVGGFSVATACIEAIALTIVVGTLRRGSRQSVSAILLSFAQGAERAVTVAVPCALAGVIVGVVAFTGLGTKFTGFIVALSDGSIVLAVGLTILATLVLGFGMPTTSAYVMGAILLAPALVKVGFLPISAHMLVFYFAILSMVTPPIALAAYAAAGISGSPPGRVGWTAFKLALPVMLIPIMFLYRTELLMIGSPLEIVFAFAITLAAVTAGAAATVGWLLGPVSFPGRILLAVDALLFVMPRDSFPWWLVAVALLVAILVWQQVRPSVRTSGAA
jgi:TRAP transporter 4TM/12TM fusion protein